VPRPAPKTALYIRYNCRNRLLLAGSLGPGTFLRWLVLAPAYGWEVVRRGGRRRLLRHPSLMLACVRGTGEGAAIGGRLVASGLRPRRRTAAR
jgi:hypothetical protein